MPTIPTGEVEREMRKRYLRFISGITMDSSNLDQKLRDLEKAQIALIEDMGGRAAMLGSLGGFPAPRYLDLSPWAGTVYNEMQTTAIKAGIIAGSSSKEAARAMFRAGMDKSYRKLERLARTETTNAYWKNAWGSIADLPLLVMVWGSEDGPRTCAWCRERDGMVISGDQVRDHPNGRCTPIPTLRSQVQYRGSVDQDGSLFNDPEWSRQKKAAPVVQEMRTLSPEELLGGTRNAERARVAMEKEVFTRKGGLNEAKGWTNATHRSWTSYTEGGGREINNMLRDPKAFAKTDLGSDEYFANLLAKQSDDVLGLLAKHELKEDIVVARGVTEYPGFTPTKMKPGDIYSDPAFLSTTTDLKEAADFATGRGTGAEGWTFLSKAPAGTQAIPGAGYQKELVFKPGQRQRVLGVDRQNKIIYTEMIP